MYRTLIVEDDPVARKLFSLFVMDSDEFDLIGTLESAYLAESYCLANDIELVLMDICTSGHSSGLDMAIKIKKSMPEVKIILVTSQPEVDFIDRAKQGNIDSFWYKTTEEMELIDVMTKTMAGEQIYPLNKPSVRLGNIEHSELSELQLKILRELTTGDPTKIIAERLHISDRTVDNNISIMLDKTGFSTRTMLACAAVESGIVIKGY